MAYCDAIMAMRISTTGRLTGLDAARTLAILGMFAAHIFPLYVRDEQGQLQATATGLLASGRASVLFMVLAGVSLGLFTRSLERRGMGSRQRILVILRRAAIITVLGMLIGPINEGIANILVHYGLLFAVLSVVVFLPFRALAPLAVVWLVVTPILWRPLAYSWQENTLGHNPSFLDFTTPGLLLIDLTVTGFYPLLVWCGYGLLGLSLSRLNLGKALTAGWLLAIGTLVATGSQLVGWAISGPLALQISRATGWTRDAVSVAMETGRAPGGNIDSMLFTNQYLWLPAPHSTSLINTLHTAGCAVAVLGLLLLLTDRLGYFGGLLAAAGRAPLTLYAGHLVLLPILKDFAEPWTIWWSLCTIVLVTAIILKHTGRSAPLEAGVSYLSGARPSSA